MGKSITEQRAKLNQDKARAEKEIYQLQNKQKILRPVYETHKSHRAQEETKAELSRFRG